MTVNYKNVWYFVVLLQFTECIFSVTLLDQEAATFACNEWWHNGKIILLLYYNVPVLAVLHKLNTCVFIANRFSFKITGVTLPQVSITGFTQSWKVWIFGEVLEFHFSLKSPYIFVQVLEKSLENAGFEKSCNSWISFRQEAVACQGQLLVCLN